VKRVSADHQGQPVRGVCSNYLCDLQRGEKVQVIGPFGNTFLMPNHADIHMLMICTGTG
jgi:benzoyl-CoA 2,3-dioxygenase component A